MDSIEVIIPTIRLWEENSLLSFMEGRINVPLIRKLLSLRYKTVADEVLIEGSSFLQGHLADEAYRLCCGVQSSLGFEYCKIEYLTSTHPKINAVSFFNGDYSEDHPHYIILNPNLVDILDEAELSFVIGHEIGHLMFEHDHFRRVVQFIYPNLKRMPYLLRNQYELWSQLAEMSADRVGLMAAKEIELAVTAMYKCSHGPRRRYRKTGYADLVTASFDLLREMSATSFQSLQTHPADPFRIKALKLFSESKTWSNYLKGRPLRKDRDLDASMEELVSLMKRSPGCDIAKAELEFLASAGYMLIASDRDVGKEEVAHLKNLLSRYLYLPHGFVTTLGKRNLRGVLKHSAEYILVNYPKRTKELFMALLPLITRDGRLNDREVDLGLKIATEYLNIEAGEAVDLVLGAIRELYAPFS